MSCRLARHESPLGAVLADLGTELAAPETASPEVSRIYADGGQGAHDRAAVARLRSVLRGDLDAFLEAWRARA